MGIIATNIEYSYQPGLTLNYALRELQANGHDAEAAGLGKFSIEYNARATHEGIDWLCDHVHRGSEALPQRHGNGCLG
jgi:hypothetical protein